MTVTVPICLDCKHFRRHVNGLTCDAFPDGIPDEVLENGNKHDKPIAGDHGIRFEPLDEPVKTS